MNQDEPGLGVGILGVGVIALAGEAARICFGLPLDWFWLMTGIIFAVWGICELLKVQFGGSLVPILCIVLGVAILTTAFRPKPRH